MLELKAVLGESSFTLDLTRPLDMAKPVLVKKRSPDSVMDMYPVGV